MLRQKDVAARFVAQVNIGRAATDHAGACVVKVGRHHGGVVAPRTAEGAHRTRDADIAAVAVERDRSAATVKSGNRHGACDVDGGVVGGDVGREVTGARAGFGKATIGRNGHAHTGGKVGAHHKIAARIHREFATQADGAPQHHIAGRAQRKVVG